MAVMIIESIAFDGDDDDEDDDDDNLCHLFMSFIHYPGFVICFPFK